MIFKAGTTLRHYVGCMQPAYSHAGWS